MVRKGKMNVRTKTVINNNLTEQVNSLKLLRVHNYREKQKRFRNANGLNQMCGTIIRKLNKETRCTNEVL
jgi:hypothetical protein